eukprot:CAMPEP_0113641164 /NCGR_PEP_ID=MMETSP0017_2-20120614/21607_1 /TAXON_ID=2856 /ORGANISM="Cylindrotheca closterium" /LENGTH=1123 /DNA_ID=CAMNT_0000552487 /DNA_START=20 /DNA_END=3391 /DNA_ORIENTATION=- /assembly_acc=CAM_ASM_000147
MRFLLLVLSVLAVKADNIHDAAAEGSLRGVLNTEDEAWYDRMLQNNIGSVPTMMPTPCSNEIENCPVPCWEVDPANRPPTCTALNRPDCQTIPLPDGCPLCCPEVCIDPNIEDCAPTPLPSQAPSDCAEVIDICPFDSCFLPLTDSSRPAQCSAGDQCNMLPQPTGVGCSCCPDECTPENPMFTPSPDGSPPACSPTPLPSQAPSDCAEVIDICPFDSCFLPLTDSSRPDSCSAIGGGEGARCDMLPQPSGCSCCPEECTPENPMFSPSPDGSPPVCSPTPLPSQAPSDCAEVIDICPFDTCFLPLTDSSRPATCNAGDQCNMLPQPTGVGCSCCPDECTPENPMFSPSPDGSPPACSPTTMPSPAPTFAAPAVIPSESPSAAPSDCAEVINICPFDDCFLPLSDSNRPTSCSAVGGGEGARCDMLPQPSGCSCCPEECTPDNPMFNPSPDGSPPVCSPTAMPSPDPTPAPSPMPSDCAEVINICPFDECFLPDGTAGRPVDCSATGGAAQCDVLPQPAGCNCCPTECRSDNPMFFPAPDGSPPVCSPTAMPSPAPTVRATSPAPSQCQDVLDQCPFDSCFLPVGQGRPDDCSRVNPACNQLPFPRNAGCPVCCPDECSPDNPMFDGTICSPTPMPSPQPTPLPSPSPSACQEVLDQCPYDECFLANNDGNRPQNCRDTNAANICNVLPQPFGCPRCCPDECRRDNPMFDGTVCAPTSVPSPAPSMFPTEPVSELPTTVDCGIDVDINVACSTSCEFDNCVERPFRMVMFYRGGGCQNTMFRRCPERNPDPTPQLPNPDPCTCNKQELPCSAWNNKNFCTDFNPSTGQPCNDLSNFCNNQANKNPIPNCGPPSNFQDHAVWIEAFGKDGEAYFIGPVNVNSTWTAQTVNEKVQADTDIFIHEFGVGGKGRLLQQVRFHSSCSDELFLTDQFGSNQLIEFESFCTDDRCDSSCFGGRRIISLFQESIGDFQFSLRARSDGQAPVTISFFAALLTPISDTFPFFGNTTFQEFSDQVGRTIPPPVTVQPNFNIRLDDEYILAAVITGQRAGGSCDSFGQTDFKCQRVPRCSLVPSDCGCDPFLAPNGKNAQLPEDEEGEGEDSAAETEELTSASALDGFTRFFGNP